MTTGGVTGPHDITHCSGSPPFFTQRMAQSSCIAHMGSMRQGAAWAQHAAWMQLPHVVPSLGHGVVAHTPCAHAPPQHCAALVQGVPTGSHVVAPHVPCELQGPEQHIWLGSHIAPSGRQGVSPQTPLTQPPEQHGAVVFEHDPPTGTQAVPPQTPSEQGRLSQHGMSMPPPQGVPIGSQSIAPHTPSAQTPLQQSSSVWQPEPSGEQFAHVPF